ncbi:MAG: hypothetical protein KDB14_19630 [Planctomycetales bacterium]|nr:hypothetical protein [Planctomycetales bacterium]
MILTIVQSTREETIDEPSNEDVVAAIGGISDDGYVVLFQDENTFIQAGYDPNDGMLLEHQAGSEDEFYMVNSDVSRDDVTRCFLAYLAGDTAGWQAMEWEQVAAFDEDELVISLLTHVSSDALEEGVLEVDDFVELPYVAAHHFVTLYQALCGGDYEAREAEFLLITEAELEDMNQSLVYSVPDEMCLALEAIGADQVADVARRWSEMPESPAESLDDEAMVEALGEIVNVARQSAAQSHLLLLCEIIPMEGYEDAGEDLD